MFECGGACAGGVLNRDVLEAAGLGSAKLGLCNDHGMVRITNGRLLEITGVSSRWYSCGRLMAWDSSCSAKHRSMLLTKLG